MRIVGEIPHPECRITLFHWNNRYLIKLEQDKLEQTFKIEQYEFEDEKEVATIVTPAFIEESLSRFDSMRKSLMMTLRERPDGGV